MSADDIVSLDYQERAVAFIDILGFAALVKASGTDRAARDKVGKLIMADQLYSRVMGKFLDFAEFTFLSDSFVISTEPVNRTIHLVRETGLLCRYLLLKGFPCRGAITTGLLHHRERVVVGPAFLKAYQLERTVAVYPRIVLDNVTVRKWIDDECAPDTAQTALKPLVKQDRDGLHFLDIFHPKWFDFPRVTELDPSFGPEPLNAVEFLKVALKPIRDGLSEYSGNPKVHAKYAWLETEHRESSVALELKGQ
jgi:hypothetical protein